MATYSVSTAASSFNFSSSGVDGANTKGAVLMDANHILYFWYGQTSIRPNAQVAAVNTSTWAITTAGSVLQIETGSYGNETVLAGDLWKFDTTHAIVFFKGVNTTYLPYAQTLAINTTTWAVTTAAAAFKYFATGLDFVSAAQIDTNHFLVIGANINTNASVASVIAVNTTTWAITTSATAFTAATDYTGSGGQKLVNVFDAAHYLFVYSGTSDVIKGLVIAVNTTTYAISTAGSTFSMDTGNGNAFGIGKLDTNHVAVVYGRTGANGLTAQILAVNTSTFAVSTATTLLNMVSNTNMQGASIIKIDSGAFIVFSSVTDSDGWVYTVSVNSSTWAMANVSNLEFDTQNGQGSIAVQIDSTHYVNNWMGVVANDINYVQTFATVAPPIGPANLKTYNTNTLANIKTIDTNAIANVKTLNTNA